jgi:hypothetical protein
MTPATADKCSLGRIAIESAMDVANRELTCSLPYYSRALGDDLAFVAANLQPRAKLASPILYRFVEPQGSA